MPRRWYTSPLSFSEPWRLSSTDGCQRRARNRLQAPVGDQPRQLDGVGRLHQMVVDAFTPEMFNLFFRPILQIPAVFLSLSFACLSLCFGFLAMTIKCKTKGQMAPKGQSFKYNRR